MGMLLHLHLRTLTFLQVLQSMLNLSLEVNQLQTLLKLTSLGLTGIPLKF